ncbi:MAG TPA: signal peptidase II [Thermoanaerobaculia bacterium]|nr:signal peptidase II [Thermoanaerobaculia bacterium]
MRTPVSQLKARLGLVSLAVLVLDQWTKHLAENALAGRPPLTVVPGFLDLVLVENTGVAFGLFAAGSSSLGVLALTLLGLVALGLVLYYFWRTPENNRVVLFSLALILGGAIGNLVDRVMSGSVTDFIDVYVGTHHWPTFNAADSAITVGIVLLSIDALWVRRPAEPETP